MKSRTMLYACSAAVIAGTVAQCRIDKRHELCDETAPACRELKEHLSEDDRYKLEIYRNKIWQECKEAMLECKR